MGDVCQAEIITDLTRKAFVIQPYSGPIPTRDHAKVVIESEKVISGEVEKTL